jgi:hypothetical protein
MKHQLGTTVVNRSYSKYDDHTRCESTRQNSKEHAEIIDKASWSTGLPIFANFRRVAAIKGAGGFEILR